MLKHDLENTILTKGFQEPALFTILTKGFQEPALFIMTMILTVTGADGIPCFVHCLLGEQCRLLKSLG
jgi:hypothetical protein